MKNSDVQYIQGFKEIDDGWVVERIGVMNRRVASTNPRTFFASVWFVFR